MRMIDKFIVLMIDKLIVLRGKVVIERKIDKFIDPREKLIVIKLETEIEMVSKETGIETEKKQSSTMLVGDIISVKLKLDATSYTMIIFHMRLSFYRL